MCHDRMDGEEIAPTHEYTASMLGVGRSSVTQLADLGHPSLAAVEELLDLV